MDHPLTKKLSTLTGAPADSRNLGVDAPESRGGRA